MSQKVSDSSCWWKAQSCAIFVIELSSFTNSIVQVIQYGVERYDHREVHAG